MQPEKNETLNPIRGWLDKFREIIKEVRLNEMYLNADAIALMVRNLGKPVQKRLRNGAVLFVNGTDPCTTTVDIVKSSLRSEGETERLSVVLSQDGIDIGVGLVTATHATTVEGRLHSQREFSSDQPDNQNSLPLSRVNRTLETAYATLDKI